VVVTVGLTVVAGALYGYTDRAADDVLERTPYVTAVFGDPVPAEEGE
jgi:multicomponent Na+:H+ antiporter subunit D